MFQFKKARKFTDQEQWVLHGVDPQECREEFRVQKQLRAKIEIEAAIKAGKHGHILFANWSPLLTNRCRKCGMTIELHNIIDKTDAPNITGAAAMNPCNVHLNGNNSFAVSDEYLKVLNEPKTTTIL